MRVGRDGFANGKLAQFLFECPIFKSFSKAISAICPVATQVAPIPQAAYSLYFV